METSSAVLLSTAATVGLVHTLVGVDHSMPFVVLARAQRWSLRKLLGVTTACGGLHVISSVLIGLIGVGLGPDTGHVSDYYPTAIADVPVERFAYEMGRLLEALVTR